MWWAHESALLEHDRRAATADHRDGEVKAGEQQDRPDDIPDPVVVQLSDQDHPVDELIRIAHSAIGGRSKTEEGEADTRCQHGEAHEHADESALEDNGNRCRKVHAEQRREAVRGAECEEVADVEAGHAPRKSDRSANDTGHIECCDAPALAVSLTVK
jgi:hypothetical protein